jgi:hypothetical protein
MTYTGEKAHLKIVFPAFSTTEQTDYDEYCRHSSVLSSSKNAENLAAPLDMALQTVLNPPACSDLAPAAPQLLD